MSKVGVSTYFDMQSPLESVLTRAVEELGVECVEILSDGKHDITRADIEVCESFELTYSVHAPMESNLASLREVLRRAAVEQIGEVLTAAAGIEAKVVVVHPGYFMWDYEEEEAYEACRTSLHTLEGMQKEYGITIAVENMTGWGNTILTQPEHLDVLGGLGMTLDVGHANVMGRLYDFLESERIVHAHIHDNHGEDDEHAPLGTGNIDFKRVFQKLDRLSILCILEMSSIEDAKTSLAWLSKNGMKPSSYIEQHR